MTGEELERSRMFCEFGVMDLPAKYILERRVTPDPTEEEILVTLKNRANVRKRLGFPTTPYAPVIKKELIECPPDIEEGI